MQLYLQYLAFSTITCFLTLETKHSIIHPLFCFVQLKLVCAYIARQCVWVSIVISCICAAEQLHKGMYDYWKGTFHATQMVAFQRWASVNNHEQQLPIGKIASLKILDGYSQDTTYSTPDQLVPAWTGFTQLTASNTEEASSVSYLPIINAPAHERDTLWTVLNRCMQIWTTELNRGQSSIVTFDEQLYQRPMNFSGRI